jgi:type III restriction enzyme
MPAKPRIHLKRTPHACQANVACWRHFSDVAARADDCSLGYPEYLAKNDKAFHLDAYCFDSKPEHEFFKRVLALDEVEKIYFTGMLVHGQSGFQVNYIDPDSHTVRNYHPDFLVRTRAGRSIIVEVENDWTPNDPVVQAEKEAASTAR